MAVEFGKSYTDPKTQRNMMRFLSKSNQLTKGTRRLGKAKPNTQLNRDAKPKNDSYGPKIVHAVSKGSPKGPAYDERLNTKPMGIKARNEKQQNNYKPRAKKATARPRNNSKVNRSYK